MALLRLWGPGVGLECSAQDGLHIFEDHFYPEIIDPETFETVEDGEKGELVLTTLTREGTPLLRFRTKDVTKLTRSECKCGRTLVRMERVKGRTDDMMKIRGVSVFPSQIEKALLRIDGVEPHYQIIVTRPHLMDEMEVRVEASEDLFSDEIKELVGIREKIEQYIHNEIGLRVKVTLVEPKTIPRSEGKAVCVIDKRTL